MAFLGMIAAIYSSATTHNSYSERENYVIIKLRDTATSHGSIKNVGLLQPAYVGVLAQCVSRPMLNTSHQMWQ